MLENLWQETKHQQGLAQLDQLQSHIDVDVAVVGGGFSGLSTALHLAQQGVSVTVLEAQEIAFGASGRNVGLTNAGLWIMPDRTLNLLGERQGKMLNKLLIDAPCYVRQLILENQIDCDYTANGTLHLAHSTASLDYLQQRMHQLSAYSANMQMLDKTQAFSHTQAEGYYGALQDLRAGTLQPVKYCQGLAVIALKSGASIYTHSAVKRIEKNAAGLCLQTTKGSVQAKKVVLATNAYEQHLQYSKGLYTPLFYCQLASQPLSAEQRKHCLVSNMGCWDTGRVMRSFRTAADGRLIVGTVGNIHLKNAQGFESWTRHVVNKTFPHIGDLEYQFAWAGRIAKSHNNIPMLNLIDDDILQILGYSGRGIAGATVTGREIANYLTAKTKPMDIALPMNCARSISFNKLRAAVYEVGSQISHLSDHFLR